MKFESLVLFGIVVLGLLLEGTIGHSYLTAPTSRSDQRSSTTGCRGPNCLGPCDRPASQPRTAINIQRGQSINLQWPRNNHAGGFIRVAWALTADSDSHSAFDNNVQEVSCHERGGCKPDDPSKPNEGDSGPADGSSQPCQLSIVVPPHLTDGKWTLQWAWFGGAFALGDYYSCVDYQISGGASGSKPTPFFVGGDYSYPGQQKCKFFNTDRLHACVNEPCNNPVYTLNQERSGAPYGISSNSPGPSPPPAAVTTGVRAATTGQRASSVTTGQRASSVTTGARTNSVTTGVRVISSTSTGGGNTAMCYLPGTPNLNGKIRSDPPTCGRKSPRSRCADGQCCSQYGYCGPFAEDGKYYEYLSNDVKREISSDTAFFLYCNKTSADYRKVPCYTIQGTANQGNANGKEIGASISLVDIHKMRALIVIGVVISFVMTLF